MFSVFLLIGEFFSGTEDIFHTSLGINLTQIGSIIGIFISGIWLLRKIQKIEGRAK